METYARQGKLTAKEFRALALHAPTSEIAFWYRQSATDLAPTQSDGVVTYDEPPNTTPGMVRVDLDPEGHLLGLDAAPAAEIEVTDRRPADWSRLFDAAGLRAADWTPVAPNRLPAMAFDELASWTGAYPYAPSVPFRIDAAAWQGRPVHFEIRGPWVQPRGPLQGTANQRTSNQRRELLFFAAIVTSVCAIVAWLAIRNYSRGRGDTEGAWRLAALVFTCGTIRWLLETHPSASPTQILHVLPGVRGPLGLAAIAWVFYMALEPSVRRRWPESLVSWTRLLRGDVRDPVVAGHVLAGTALGIGYVVFFSARSIVQGIGGVPALAGLENLGGPVSVLSAVAFAVQTSILVALGLFVLFFLIRALLRRTWLAVTVVMTMLFLLSFAQGGWTLALCAAVQNGVSTIILIRFGVLPLVVALFVNAVLSGALTTNLSAWWASGTLTAVAIVLALSSGAFAARSPAAPSPTDIFSRRDPGRCGAEGSH